MAVHQVLVYWLAGLLFQSVSNMTIRNIDDIAYVFKTAKECGGPAPIILIGAGASASAGIPLANEIRLDVLKQFEKKPTINRLSDDEKLDYYSVMGALSPDERRTLFYNYISSEKVRINLTHIYLAQLIKEGYVDYILTPNFDDLLLRACALFNFIPPVYDVSIIQDFTTTTFRKKSVTYLHGQYHGQWLLNAQGELEKVKKSVPKILERICNNRAWIIIGYSGQDEILNEISKLGSFDNELFWIGYKNIDPDENVKNKILNLSSLNAHLVRGYSSDSFFLTLHSQLKLHTPDIFNRSFSFLEALLMSVKDIDESNESEALFKDVAERLNTTKKLVTDAINRFEKSETIELFRQNIIEDQIKKNYSNADLYLEKFETQNYSEASGQVAQYLNSSITEMFRKTPTSERSKEVLEKYLERFKKVVELAPKYSKGHYNCGLMYKELGTTLKSEKLLLEAIQCFKISADSDPSNYRAYKRWGDSFFALYKLTSNVNWALKSLAKYKKATEINPIYYDGFLYWGLQLYIIANKTLNEQYYYRSINKFRKAIKVNEERANAYEYLGVTLLSLSNIKRNDFTLIQRAIDALATAMKIGASGVGALVFTGNCYSVWGKRQKNVEKLYQSLDFYNKALQTDPDSQIALRCFASAYYNIASITKEINLFDKSIELANKSVKINPTNAMTFNVLSLSFVGKAKLMEDGEKEVCIQSAIIAAKKCYELGGSPYNLACIYALMKNESQAFYYLRAAFNNKSSSLKYIHEDEDWKSFFDHPEFKEILKGHNINT